MLKNFLNSRKSLGKSGMLGGLVNRSGSNVEVFDDHWAGKHLKSERTWLVEDLQDLAAEKSVRVTILRYGGSLLEHILCGIQSTNPIAVVTFT